MGTTVPASPSAAPDRLVSDDVRGAQDLAGHQYDQVSSQIGYAPS